MKKKILMLGFSKIALNNFKHRDDIEFYIIEEKEVFENNQLDKTNYSNIKRVVFGNYIDSEDCIPLALSLNKEIGFNAVFPSKDYSVKVTTKIADLLNLPGLKANNDSILTNKVLLRNACEDLNIPHPKFKKIKNKQELFNFYTGKPLIFKPATMQASMGISKIETIEDIDGAWTNTVSTVEDKVISVSRDITRENIVEEYITGPEFSIETLVENNKIIFSNITEKVVYEDNFVEKGHTVPANLNTKEYQMLLNEQLELVKKLGVGSGILHSEWKIQNDSAFLIECAGRLPGDSISELISLSYGFDFVNEYLKVLLNEKNTIPEAPIKISAIRFFNCPSGVLKEIKNLDILDLPEVVTWTIEKSAGDFIPEINSSWDRIGYFIIVSDSYSDIEKISQKILNGIEFVV